MRIDRRRLLASGLAAGVASAAPGLLAATSVQNLTLWPDRPPGGEGLNVRDESVLRSLTGSPDDIAWPHVALPTLTVTPAVKPNGGAVLLVPGGSYTRVALRRGGSEVAQLFAGRGVTAFDLRYRLPHDGWAAGPDAPLQDAQRALRLIRARAGTWGIDPKRIAALGFSAGGHLAARLGSRAGLATYSPLDAADRESARPTVLGLFYPVITLLSPDAHAASQRALLGNEASEERQRRFSADAELPPDMPPTFVTAAANDPVVKPANALRMFAALQAANVPSELMLFELGGHDLPLTQPDGQPHPWPALFTAFATRHGF